MTTQKTATSIKINPEVWKKAKIAAINHEKDVSQIVEEALTQWMKDHRK